MTRRRAAGAVGGFVLVLGMLALTACGGPGAGAAAKPTPTPNAQTILANASKVDYKDIEFKMTFSGTSSGTSATGTGSGTITKSPNRADLKLTVAADGQNLNVEVLEDGDANTTYVKVSGMSALGIPDDKWIKESGSGSGSLSSISDLFAANEVTSFKDLQGVSLVGSETVDGVAVWHLRGNATQDGTSGTADFYVKQSDNTPYKFVIHATGASSGDFTITFTGVNTGATVTLPTPDQIMELPGA